MASPAAKWLGADADRAGRVKVTPALEVPGHANVFAIGDTALVSGEGGRPVPGVAPAAKQMGTYVGGLIDARIRGKAAPRPFRYRDMGSLATIGRKAAVAKLGPVRLKGFVAWSLWAMAHVYFLIGWRNRLVVSVNWFWSYLTFERGARLITGASSEAMGAPPAPAADPPSARCRLTSAAHCRRHARICQDLMGITATVGRGPQGWPMSLENELERRRAAVAKALPAEDLKIIRETVERLRMLQLAEHSLAAGDHLPDLALPDDHGRIVSSEELLAQGTLVLAFFRGGWCPFCDAALEALEAARPALEELGARLVGVSPLVPGRAGPCA